MLPGAPHTGARVAGGTKQPPTPTTTTLIIAYNAFNISLLKLPYIQSLQIIR